MPVPKKYDQFAVPFVPGEPTIPLPAPLSNLAFRRASTRPQLNQKQTPCKRRPIDQDLFD